MAAQSVGCGEAWIVMAPPCPPVAFPPLPRANPAPAPLAPPLQLAQAPQPVAPPPDAKYDVPNFGQPPVAPPLPPPALGGPAHAAALDAAFDALSVFTPPLAVKPLPGLPRV